MTRFAPLWQQNSTFPAVNDRMLIGTLWPTSGSTGGAAAAQPNTMTVSIAAGTAAVALTAGNYTALCRWDAPETVTLNAVPPTGQTRVDLVYLQVRDAAIDAGSNNDFLFAAAAGAPTTGTPVVPTVPVNAYPICQVLVPGAPATNLNGATFTDRRVALNPRDTMHAKVYRNAAFMVGTAAGPLGFDTVQRDPFAMWVPAQNAFIVSTAGVYLVSASLICAPNAGTGQFLALNVVVAGTVVASAAAHQSMSFGFGALVATPVLAAAGGGIQATASVAPTAMNGQTGPASTFMAVSYLGTG